MFKVGDKVRRTGKYLAWRETGFSDNHIGVITNINSKGDLEIDGKIYAPYVWWHSVQFELVQDTKKMSDFKVGDTVKVVKGGYHSPALKIGDIHTIREIDSLQVISDTNCWMEHELDELELVQDEQTFDWDKFKTDKIAVNCETQEEYDKFIEMCTSRGLLFITGNHDVSGFWSNNKTCIGYSFIGNDWLGYAKCEFYVRNSWQVVKFKDAFTPDNCKVDVKLTHNLQSVDVWHPNIHKPKEIEYI